MELSWLKLGVAAAAAATESAAVSADDDQPGGGAAGGLAGRRGGEVRRRAGTGSHETPEEKLAAWQREYQEQMMKFQQAGGQRRLPKSGLRRLSCSRNRAIRNCLCGCTSFSYVLLAPLRVP
jgi:hypothetical protein